MSFPEPNDHGVYPIDQAERLAIDFESNLGVEIHILQVGKDEWLGCAHINLPNTGVGWGLSRKRGVFENRDGVVIYHRDYIKSWCLKEAERSDTTQTAKDMIEKVLEWLESLQQMRMF